jgi:hypothetical protein
MIRSKIRLLTKVNQRSMVRVAIAITLARGVPCARRWSGGAESAIIHR